MSPINPQASFSRRQFINTAGAGLLATGATLRALSTMQAAPGTATASGTRPRRPKNIGALYFRAQLYTLVPRQVREDMEWMRDARINTLVIGVLEQDLDSARENIDRISAEAHRVGIKIWVTPSRWGNLLAGAGKVPCTFTGKNPDCWALRENGKPIMGMLGPYASIHHPRTFERYARMLRRLFTQWPVEGIVWDEPKAFNVIDHSPAAQAAFDGKVPADIRPHRQAFVKFFARLNTDIIKKTNPACHTSMFTYATLKQEEIEDLAGQPGLDAFGCDGRPWALADKGADDSKVSNPATKCLIDDGPRFMEIARRHGCETLVLIENHAMPATSNPIMDRRLPEVLAQGWDNLLCYYYPRSCDDPDASMAILKKHLAGL
jgi:hypothetical protein